MRSSRSRRERTEWFGVTSVTPTVVAVGQNSNQILLGPAAAEEWPGGRIDRLIGQAFFSPATAPVAATGYGIFFGFDFLEEIAGAFNDPETALDHRWIHWDSCFPQIGGTGVADSNASRWIGYFRFGFDIRIRRRLTTDSTLSFIVKNSGFSGASIQFSYAYRLIIAAGAK